MPSNPAINPDIAINIANVRQRIGKVCVKSGRAESAVRLLAVSKTQSSAAIRAAVAAGVLDIGENYWQEAEHKQLELADLPITWHFIGPLQANKTRAIAAHFQWVHSIDRLKIAERLAAQRPSHLPALDVCIQININDEAAKGGVDATELATLAAAISALPRLRLRGLMAIPRASTDTAEQHRNFARVRELFEQLRARWPQLDTLSMGMSADLEAAIAEGATIVRIGTDIFGARPLLQS